MFVHIKDESKTSKSASHPGKMSRELVSINIALVISNSNAITERLNFLSG